MITAVDRVPNVLLLEDQPEFLRSDLRVVQYILYQIEQQLAATIRWLEKLILYLLWDILMVQRGFYKEQVTIQWSLQLIQLWPHSSRTVATTCSPRNFLT